VLPGVLDGVDLVYEAHGDGLKETLVLDSPDAGSLFTFFLDTDGVSLEQDPLGCWTLRDEADAPVMSLGGVCVFDSSRNEADDPRTVMRPAWTWNSPTGEPM